MSSSYSGDVLQTYQETASSRMCGPQTSQEIACSNGGEPQTSQNAVSCCRDGPQTSQKAVSSCRVGSQTSQEEVSSCMGGSQTSQEAVGSCRGGSQTSQEEVSSCRGGSQTSQEAVGSCMGGCQTSQEAVGSCRGGSRVFQEAVGFYRGGPQTSQEANNSCRSGPETSYQKVSDTPGSLAHSSLFYMFTYPSLPSYSSGEETKYSYQAYETEYCQDSVDDEPSSSDEPVDNTLEVNSDTFSVEYDVESLPDIDKTENLSDSYTTDFLEDEDVMTAFFIATCNDSDIEFWADSEDQELDSNDPELSEEDKWRCVNCGEQNKPLTRHCQKCWQVRKHWLPRSSRWKGKKKKTLLRSESDPCKSFIEPKMPVRHILSESYCRQYSTSSTISEGSEGCSSQSQEGTISSTVEVDQSSDVTSKLSLSSHISDRNIIPGDHVHFIDTCVKNKTSGTSSASGMEYSDSQMSADSIMIQDALPVTDNDLFTPVDNIDILEKKRDMKLETVDKVNILCDICLVRPKNASLIHGRIGHQVTCYPCGTKLWKNKSLCPICRRKITQVIKNFIF